MLQYEASIAPFADFATVGNTGVHRNRGGRVHTGAHRFPSLSPKWICERWPIADFPNCSADILDSQNLEQRWQLLEPILVDMLWLSFHMGAYLRKANLWTKSKIETIGTALTERNFSESFPYGLSAALSVRRWRTSGSHSPCRRSLVGANRADRG